MDESTCKTALVRRLREALPGFVIIRHEERFNSGTPDMSVTGNRHGSWWEIKFANPGFKCPSVQKLQLKRLAKAGYANFIVFVAPRRGAPAQTLIVHPDHIDAWRTNWSHAREGFDYSWLVSVVKEAHDYHF